MIVRDKSSSVSLLFARHGTVLPRVLPLVIAIICLSLIASVLTQLDVYAVRTVPAVGFTIFGVILSIFLGFRNSACYERWWEGRKLWGALVANSRHFSRDSRFLPSYERALLLVQMLVFIGLLRDRLRGQLMQREDITAIIAQWQNADEKALLTQHFDSSYFNWLDKQMNAPQQLLDAMQQGLIAHVKAGYISDIIYMSIQKHLVEMGNIQAGCDRIFSTPLPFPYSVLLHRAVFCFCWLLPFGLEPALGLWTPLLVGLISYLLLGLDELSRQLEEPFGSDSHDLALDAMVRMMSNETLMLLNQPLLDAWQADEKYNLT